MTTPRHLTLLSLALLASVACRDQVIGVVESEPEAEITSHEDGDVVQEGVSAILRGTARSDAYVEADLEVTWLLQGAVICTGAPQSDGETACEMWPTPTATEVLLEVRDPAAESASDGVSLTVIPVNHAPTCEITFPASGASGEVGEMVVFTASVSDDQTAANDLAVAWSSDADGALGTSVPSSGGEVAFPYDGLSCGTHVVTLLVTDEGGEDCSDFVLFTVTSPPTVTWNTPAAGATYDEGEAIPFEVAVGDCEDDPTELILSWESDLDGVFSTQGADGAGTAHLDSAALAWGTHAITVTATDTDGEKGEATRSVVVNGLPSAPVVAIAPATPDDADDLVASVVAASVDPEGQAVAYAWAWFLDGVRQPSLTTATVPASETATGDLWRVEATPNDGRAEGPAGADEIVVGGNAKPAIQWVSPASGSAFAQGATVPLEVSVSDAEDAPTALSLEWESDRDGVFSSQGADGSGAAHLDWDAFSVGTHTLTVTVTDTGSLWARVTNTVQIDVLPPFDTSTCELPAVYTRVLHTQGNVDLTAVDYAKDGSYALILGYSGKLYRYDAATDAVTLVSSTTQYWNDVVFSEDGSYALVGGSTAFEDGAPALHRYTEAGGLVAVADITGIPQGKLPAVASIRALAQQPGTGTWAILTDNTADYPSQIAYFNTFTPDWAGGSHTWVYEGGAYCDQTAASVAWGKDLGQTVALANDRYLELYYYNPALASGRFATQSHVNTGNLSRIRFAPDGQVAWVMQWSGQGKVYAWEGVLRNDAQNSYGFTSWTQTEFNVSPDGYWKVFIGRNGAVWFSDSPWRPVDSAKFHTQYITPWDQSPWNGTSNDYLAAVAWRPGTCEGIIVGDAVGNQGLIAVFGLY